MRSAAQVRYIVIHTTAGYGNRQAVERYWKSIGWKRPGYHRLVEENGKIEKLSDFNQITNGVAGWNSESIHIAYVGGVVRGNVNVPLDSRNSNQKAGLLTCIHEAVKWIRDNGGNLDNVTILGHRDFPNVNKACPSFNAIPEYRWILQTATNPANRLPRR
jgi:N-acetylmuramoyl-L-alanine amidase